MSDKQPNQFELVEQTVFALEPIFERVSVDKGIVFAREAEFAIQIVCGSDYMRGIACENPQSLRDAVTNISAIGISLNPAKKQAYLVPRKGGITLQISWMGLLDLAIQSGSILWGQSELVYAADSFELNGYDKAPTHKRQPFSKERGEIVGTYVVVKTIDGDYLTTTMAIDEVYAIRDRSDAWKAFLGPKKTKCPWVTDEGEMIKKTVVKRASKSWPKSERLDKAVHHLNTDGGEGITFDEQANDSPVESLQMPQRKSEPKPETPLQDVEDAREVKTKSDEQVKDEVVATINAGQVKYLQQKFKALNLSDTAFDELLTKHGIKMIDTSITVDQFSALKSDLLAL